MNKKQKKELLNDKVLKGLILLLIVISITLLVVKIVQVLNLLLLQ